MAFFLSKFSRMTFIQYLNFMKNVVWFRLEIKKTIRAIGMRKREFTNRMSLRGEQESSTWEAQ